MPPAPRAARAGAGAAACAVTVTVVAWYGVPVALAQKPNVVDVPAASAALNDTGSAVNDDPLCVPVALQIDDIVDWFIWMTAVQLVIALEPPLVIVTLAQ